MSVIRANKNAKDAKNTHLTTKQTKFALSAGFKQQPRTADRKPVRIIYPALAPISVHGFSAEKSQDSKGPSIRTKKELCATSVTNSARCTIYHHAASAIDLTDD